ncbi:MAG: acyltransferase [Fermentimonas sp.]|nr:acyltransferase [Fermentimonas sp.]
MIHEKSDVLSNNIGEDTQIWQYCVVLPDAKIGSNCNICAHVFIENNVTVGDNVTIKNGVQLWDGVTIEDNVFIGPNATFTNELIPKSRVYDAENIKETIVKNGASIGANATILPGVIIGEHAFVGAGSVITSSVPPYTLYYGNPARHKGYITRSGILLSMDKRDKEGIVRDLETE